MKLIMKKQKLLGLLLAPMILAFGPAGSADPIGDITGTDPLWEDGFYAEPPLVGQWQPANELSGIECQRSRTVISGFCQAGLSPDVDYSKNLFYKLLGHSACLFRDHGIADYQVGVFVPGIGCTGWRSTSYTLVAGNGDEKTGTLIDD